MEAVVDGVASSAALTEDLPVFEADEDVFDAGADAAVSAVVVIDWSCTGIRVSSMIHGRSGLLLVSCSRALASIGTRWCNTRSTVDWLVANRAASARVVRLMRGWMSTSSSRTGSGSTQGWPRAGVATADPMSVSTLWNWCVVNPVSASQVRLSAR